MKSPKTSKEPLATKKPKNYTEKEVKKKVVTYLKSKGWVCITMYTGGIPTGFGGLVTNPAKGFPDMICFHMITKQMIYVELKRTVGGRLSPEQTTWHVALKACGQKIYVITSVEDCKKEGL